MFAPTTTATHTPCAVPGRIRRSSLLGMLRRAITARQSRRQLARLDAAALRDIGISPEAARLEATRPIWDVPANWRR